MSNNSSVVENNSLLKSGKDVISSLFGAVKEPFTTIIIEEEEPRNIDLFNQFMLILIIKLLLLYLVSFCLWPKIMPNIMPGINEKPGFWNILGLSIIVGLLQ